MKTKMIVLTAAAALALVSLAACGKAEQPAAGGGNNHGSGHASGTNQSEGSEHGGNHGGQKEEDGKGHGNHGGEGGENAETASDGLKASFAFGSGAAKANESTALTIQITDKDGKPVNEFEVNHEKLLHLIIVNHDLSHFSHIHPEFKGDGTFTVDASFPAGGEYKLFADFIPSGGSAATLSEWVKVEGKEGEHAAVTADSKLVKEVDGKEVELVLSGVQSKEEVKLAFNVRDAKTKQGIDDLEPYLGAVGHVVILSDDAEKYLHVHPLDEKATGPVAEFATSFPQAGTYKIWGQFQHDGKVFTVPFVVDVK